MQVSLHINKQFKSKLKGKMFTNIYFFKNIRKYIFLNTISLYELHHMTFYCPVLTLSYH